MLGLDVLCPSELFFNDNGYSTHTSVEQKRCEQSCVQTVSFLCPSPTLEVNLEAAGYLTQDGEILLLREKHVQYLYKGLQRLDPGFVCLDASRPWIIYWIFHSLSLLEALPDEASGDPLNILERCISTLAHCQAPTGGFGGGPQQLAHCAPTYAAVLALLLIGTERAYQAINRSALYQWFKSMKHSSGGFRMHEDGEVDVRGTYTVLAIAFLLNMLTPELCDGVAEYCARCQTYEGGMGGEPFNEAHGGYVYCGVASLIVLDQVDLIDLDSLQRWLVNRQMQLEGGFQGRTNKLVDGCYSFWQGGTIACLDYILKGRAQELLYKKKSSCIEATTISEDLEDTLLEETTPIRKAVPSSCGNASMNQFNIQKYILYCAQQSTGGLRDKPGKPRDYYHTCYNLSGLSVAQHASSDRPVVLGHPSNLLKPTSLIFNICEDKAKAALAFFQNFPCDDQALL